MIITTVQIVRNGSPVSGLTTLQNVQIDEVQADPRMFDGGAAPYDAFSIFIPYASAPILRNDQVQDMGATNTGFYRIFSKPETFLDGHWELLGFQKVGV